MAIGYNPTSVTTGLVLLLDPANPKSYKYQENLFYYSEQLGNTSYYGNTNYYNITTGTSNTYTNAVNTGSLVFSPTGSTTTNIVTGITTSQQYAYLYQSYNTSFSGVYTYSMYARPGTTSTITLIHGTNGFYAPNGTSTVYITVTVNLATTQMTLRGLSQNSSNTNSINDFSWGAVPAANGWTRYWVTANLTTSTQGGAYPLLSVSSGFYLNVPGGTVDSYGKYMYAWGMQLQQNNYLNTYYPTTNTIITPSNTLIDLSGSNNTGTLTSYVGSGQFPPVYNGSNGGIFNMSLNGYITTNSYISTYYNNATTGGYSNNPYITTQIPQTYFNSTLSNFTISTWFKFDPYYIINTNDSGGQIAGADYFGGWGISWKCTTSSYTVFSAVRDVSSNIYNVNFTPNLNTWYNAVMVYNTATSSQSFYINNTLIGTANILTLQYSITAGIYFGVGSAQLYGGAGYGTAFPGVFGPTHLYNRALRVDEINQNFAAYRGRFGI